MLVVENRFHSLYFSRPLIEPAKLQVSRARLQAAPQTQARPGAGQIARANLPTDFLSYRE